MTRFRPATPQLNVKHYYYIMPPETFNNHAVKPWNDRVNKMLDNQNNFTGDKAKHDNYDNWTRDNYSTRQGKQLRQVEWGQLQQLSL